MKTKLTKSTKDQDQPRYCFTSDKILICSNGCEIDKLTSFFQFVKSKNAFCIFTEFNLSLSSKLKARGKEKQNW